MRLGQRSERLFIAQKGAHVGQRRAGEGKLPIQDSGHLPAPLHRLHQQVAPVKIAVHQPRILAERGQFGLPQPEQIVDSAAPLGRHALLQARVGEAQVDKLRQWTAGARQRRAYGRSWPQPAGLVEPDAADRRQGFAG